MMSTAQRTGAVAVAGGVLVVVGVEGEWLLDPQRDDGTVTNVPVLAALMATAAAGFTLLWVAVRRLRHLATRTTRAVRAGVAMTTAGAVLMVVFGLLVLVPLLVTGSVLEASFLAFLLGMLLLSVGAVTWGVTVRRHSPVPGLWQLLVLSGASGLAALAIEADPWHDVALVVAFGSWAGLGALVHRHGADGVPDPARAGLESPHHHEQSAV